MFMPIYLIDQAIRTMSIALDFEPYRINTVEPIRISTRQERRRWLQEVEFNLFRLPAERVMIDLITDSGTGAMSSAQWSAMMRGDESYAGSASYQRLKEVCNDAFGIGNVIPTHQGRVSERLLVETIIGAPHAGRGMIVPNNAHFDTTRRMIEQSGAQAVNVLCMGGEGASVIAPFKGNVDLRQLEELLCERGEDVPFVMVTVTCNSNGGQPVSLENLRGVRKLCNRFGKMLFLDGCRFAENAWLIKEREARERDRGVRQIVREMFDLSDGAAMSARKDGLCNCGGLLLVRDEALYQKACGLCVLTQGFQASYGGVAGRDMEAMAVGVQEAMDESHLSCRVRGIARMEQRLIDAGVPVVRPAGGHAIYLDAEEFCGHLTPGDHPAQSLVCALYEHGGIRASRIGSVLRNERGQLLELVRLAIPRRVYTPAHLDYVVEVIIELRERVSAIKPAKMQVVEVKCGLEAALEIV
ncbi:MAG: tryptophanase [Phycisphaerales bacterium]|nr:tryptophanase [Phycisphaerales bacterium]